MLIVSLWVWYRKLKVNSQTEGAKQCVCSAWANLLSSLWHKLNTFVIFVPVDLGHQNTESPAVHLRENRLAPLSRLTSPSLFYVPVASIYSSSFSLLFFFSFFLHVCFIGSWFSLNLLNSFYMCVFKLNLHISRRCVGLARINSPRPTGGFPRHIIILIVKSIRWCHAVGCFTFPSIWNYMQLFHVIWVTAWFRDSPHKHVEPRR